MEENKFYEEHNILTNKQHGFRANFSTNSACFELFKCVTEKN